MEAEPREGERERERKRERERERERKGGTHCIPRPKKRASKHTIIFPPLLLFFVIDMCTYCHFG